jgi:putative ABC transport system permease protein
MNTFQLILKNMRQRALSTWLTVLSVTLGVTLAIAVLIFHRESDKIFGQSDFGYDVLVGTKASKLQLVLNSVYQLDVSPGNVSYAVYATMPEQDQGNLRWALPTAVGDTYKGHRVIATLPKAFDTPESRGTYETFQKLIERNRLLLQKLRDAAAKGQTDASLLDEKKALTAEIVSLRAAADLIDEEATKRIDAALGQINAAIATAPTTPEQFAAAANALTDAYRTFRNVGPALGIFEYRPGRTLKLAEGRAFHRLKFEAVIGSEIAKRIGLKIGDTFQAEHGQPTPGAEEHHHDEKWTIVGVLAPTQTALDRSLFVPLVTFYAIPEHESALEAMANVKSVQDDMDKPVTAPPSNAARANPMQSRLQQAARNLPGAAGAPATTKPAAADDWGEGFETGDKHEHPYRVRNGLIELRLPPEKRKLSAIFARSQGAAQGSQIIWRLNNGPDAQGLNPAWEMRQLFSTFLEPTNRGLLGLAVLVTVVAAVSILVSIYNSISARRREIAILRALGATKGKVLTLICLEAGLIGVAGAALGAVAGHSLAAIAATVMQETLGEAFSWLSLDRYELLYLMGVVGLAVLAGLVPALKAYQTPVASNLVAE